MRSLTRWFSGLMLALALFGSTGYAEVSDEVIARLSFDDLSKWGDSGLPADKPLQYEMAALEDVREGTGAVAVTYDATQGAKGMKYVTLPSVAGSDAFRFWVKGDGSGACLQIRLSQDDWSAWDSAIVMIDFSGWRQITVHREDTTFHNWGGEGPSWDDIKTFAVMLSCQSTTLVLDELDFIAGPPEKINIHAEKEPVTLTVNVSQPGRPLPEALKGVDFALINWGAKKKENGFDAELTKLFHQSGTRLVRFWTFCPPFEVSTAPGVYDWTRFDDQMQKIVASGAEVIMCCTFTPKWLSSDGTRKGIPTDWQAYEQLIADTVNHCKQMDYPVRYWEVWNEPDLKGERFWSGTVENLQTMYQHFTKAVKDVQPDARVGGPALHKADVSWMRQFLDLCARDSLPVDFLSWHVYDLPPRGVASSVELMRELKKKYPAYADADLVIDEWNVPGGGDFAYDHEYAAAGQIATLHAMHEAEIDAATVFAFNEDRYHYRVEPPEQGEFGGSWGLVTAANTPKAAYYAYRMFCQLHGEPVALTGGDYSLNGWAFRTGEAELKLLLYRFDTDRLSAARDVHIVIAGGAQQYRVTQQVVDKEQLNPYRTGARSVTMEDVVQISTNSRRDISIRMRPLTVTQLTLQPLSR